MSAELLNGQVLADIKMIKFLVAKLAGIFSCGFRNIAGLLMPCYFNVFLVLKE